MYNASSPAVRLQWIVSLAVGIAPLGAGCDTLSEPADPPPTPAARELEQGLVVLYPGGSSFPPEMTAWYLGLRAAGVTQAIEIVAWGTPWDNFNNLTDYDRNRAWAGGEAQRLIAYQDEHPDRPVTLIGYSAGGGIAVLVAQAIPPGRQIDRVIVMSAGLSGGFDLTTALDRTRHGIVNYWSPADIMSVAATTTWGTVDREFVAPAATTGFFTRDARLIQFSWSPDMLAYGNFGGHLDYLLDAAWVRDYVAPWVIPAPAQP